MTIPNYLQTLRQAIRELEEREKSEISEKSPTLISLNSLISHPPPSQNVEGTILERREARDSSSQARICEKSEVSEKRGRGFSGVLDALERRCPDYVEPHRWQECVEDARRFLATWGEQAVALGWTAGELFGLHKPPAKPHPSYGRLSRYDCTGLIWLLQGRRVVALTESKAAIRSKGGTVVYRKSRCPGER